MRVSAVPLLAVVLAASSSSLAQVPPGGTRASRVSQQQNPSGAGGDRTSFLDRRDAESGPEANPYDALELQIQREELDRAAKAAEAGRQTTGAAEGDLFPAFLREVDPRAAELADRIGWQEFEAAGLRAVGARERKDLASLTLSAAWCAHEGMRKWGLEGIAREKRYAKIGGELDRNEVIRYQRLAGRSMDAQEEIGKMAGRFKSPLLKCSDIRVAKLAACLYLGSARSTGLFPAWSLDSNCNTNELMYVRSRFTLQ